MLEVHNASMKYYYSRSNRSDLICSITCKAKAEFGDDFEEDFTTIFWGIKERMETILTQFFFPSLMNKFNWGINCLNHCTEMLFFI